MVGDYSSWVTLVSHVHHTAADNDNVRQATATAKAPVISQRQSSTFDVFQPVTTDEVLKLLSKAPTKHCQLDPIPTWLVKQSIKQFARILAALCNTSLQSGNPRNRRAAAFWTPGVATYAQS